jgi:predicted Fe-Mo cluster-binding NifX family protein
MEEVMRIAISSAGRDLDANLDPRFGRAAYYIILDSDTMDFYAVENFQNFNSPQGAGIQAARNIADQHIDTLITGHCGPKAFKVLQNAGIKVITGVGGRVADAVDQLKKGELEIAAGADVEGHWA